MKMRQTLLIGTMLVSIISLFLLSFRNTKTSLDYFIYVTAPGIDQFLGIDSASQSITQTIQTHWAATDIAISPIADIAFVVHSICGTSSTVNPLYVIDLQTQEIITTIAVGECAYTVNISPDGSRVYVNGFRKHETDSDIYVIDTSTYQVINTINIENSTHSGFEINSTGTTAYALVHPEKEFVEGWVSVLDLNTGNSIATISVGFFPFDAVLSPDETKLYVTSYEDHTISVIDTVQNSVIHTIEKECIPTPVYSNCHFAGITISQDGSRLYVAENIGAINVFDTNTYQLVATIPTIYNQMHLLITPDNSFLYTTSQNSTITIIDLETNTVLKTITDGIDGSYTLGLDVWIPQSQHYQKMR